LFGGDLFVFMTSEISIPFLKRVHVKNRTDWPRQLKTRRDWSCTKGRNWGWNRYEYVIQL